MTLYVVSRNPLLGMGRHQAVKLGAGYAAFETMHMRIWGAQLDEPPKRSVSLGYTAWPCAILFKWCGNARVGRQCWFNYWSEERSGRAAGGQLLSDSRGIVPKANSLQHCEF